MWKCCEILGRMRVKLVDTCFLYVRIQKWSWVIMVLFMGIFDCLKRLNKYEGIALSVLCVQNTVDHFLINWNSRCFCFFSGFWSLFLQNDLVHILDSDMYRNNPFVFLIFRSNLLERTLGKCHSDLGYVLFVFFPYPILFKQGKWSPEIFYLICHQSLFSTIFFCYI